MQGVAGFILMYIVYPVWVLAGLADWWTHRRTRIEITSGLEENVLHWFMYAEIGAGMLAVAFLEINAALLAVVLAVFAAHEATVYWDLRYSTMKRDVGPFEQMVHSFMELLPLVSAALLAPMADLGDWALRPKADPWPLEYLALAGGASVLFNTLPMVQETWSCWRARRRTRPSPGPR